MSPKLKESTLHTLRVIAFLAASGALTAVLNYLSGVHPTEPIQMVIFSAVNAALAWGVKYTKLKSEE